MTLLGYVPGVTTFLASTDMERYRLVKMKDGSLTTPVEVEYATAGVIIGVTDGVARAGELISVKPLNVDGTYQMQCTISSAITVGTLLFVTTDGKVTDDNSSGAFIGQCITPSAVEGDVVEVGGVVGAIGIAEAANVTYDNSAGYFGTADNVQTVLDTIGNAATETYTRSFAPTEFYKVTQDGNYNVLGNADYGGRLASDTALIYLDDTGGEHAIWYAETAPDNDVGPESVYFASIVRMPTKFDSSATTEFNVGVYYTCAASDGYVIYLDSTLMGPSGSENTTAQRTLPIAASITKFGLYSSAPSAVPGDAAFIFCNWRIQRNGTGAIAPVRLYGFYLDYPSSLI